MSIADDIIDQEKGRKMGEEPNTTAVKTTIHYGAESRVEVWTAGPHAAAGIVLDALLGVDDGDKEFTSITVVPNAQDVPKMPSD
jgi:hypothetical protein